jgi:triacylglycerol lipase
MLLSRCLTAAQAGTVRQRARWSVLASFSPARRRLILVLAVVVLTLALVIALVAVLRQSHDQAGAAPADQATPGPVLLVPGYGGSTTGLQVLATALRAAGRDATVLALPDGGQGDLNAQAQTLTAAAKAALARTGAVSLDVVGYSAGGVVARIWARNDGGAALARRIVTLGSPQHGTEVAALGALIPGECPLACQQLTPTSPLLAALNRGNSDQGSEVPAGPQFISLWTTHDDVVLPADSAVLNGARNIQIQSVCANSVVNHSGLPSDHLVDAMVLAQLSAGPTVALGPADCARLSS